MSYQAPQGQLGEPLFQLPTVTIGPPPGEKEEGPSLFTLVVGAATLITATGVIWQFVRKRGW